MKTTNVENNPGAASIIIDSKTLEIVCSTILAESDVEKNPLNITDAQVHECGYDEKEGIAIRKYDGKEKRADFSIMKKQRDARLQQGGEIREDGKVIKSFNRAKLIKEGKIEEIETYRNSKQKQRVSGGMEIG